MGSSSISKGYVRFLLLFDFVKKKIRIIINIIEHYL